MVVSGYRQKSLIFDILIHLGMLMIVFEKDYA